MSEGTVPGRRRVSDVEHRRLAAARALGRMSDAAMPSIGRRLDDARPKIIEMMRSGDWRSAEPIHFLALYHQQAQRIFGYFPRVNRQMVITIATCLRERFGGKPQAFARFLYWAFGRMAKNLARSRGLQWCVGGDAPRIVLPTAKQLFADEGDWLETYRSGEAP